MDIKEKIHNVRNVRLANNSILLKNIEKKLLIKQDQCEHVNIGYIKQKSIKKCKSCGC